MPVPMRQPIGRQNPQVIYEFGDKIHNKLVTDNKTQQEGRERSGKISGGKLGKPTLWAVLDIIGIPDEFDPYVLGKFQRGNDVEARAINMLTGLDAWHAEPGKVYTTDGEGCLLTGEFILQKESGYRGGTGYVDLAQMVADSPIYHEIKSQTKMAYDRTAATGRWKGKQDPSPQLQHALQVAYYCLGDDVSRGFLHYLNADDYRLVSFALNPLDYKEEIDKEIDDIQLAFATKQLPQFEGFLEWHKLKAYWSYKEWNELTPQQMMTKLQHDFPESYKKFMEITI